MLTRMLKGPVVGYPRKVHDPGYLAESQWQKDERDDHSAHLGLRRFQQRRVGPLPSGSGA